MGQIGSMEEDVTSKPMRSLKVSIMSLLILGACGAVAYNVLLRQSPKKMLPGSTAVRVQVDEVDVSDVASRKGASSIGQLLSRTANVQNSAKKTALTASVQGQLAHLGFYKGTVDGQTGPQTLEAIKVYQQRNALKQTGLVSRKLLDHLNFTRKISDAGNNTGSINPLPKQGPDIQPGIQRVQELLSQFGYIPGDPDGVMGQSTANAIKQFEADRSLPVTGKITTSLLQELGL